MDAIDGRIGESRSASPRPGHLPFLACVALGTVVRPATLIVNKSTLEGDVLPRLTAYCTGR